MFNFKNTNYNENKNNRFTEKELEEYLEKGIRDEILLPVKKGRQVIYLSLIHI